MKKGPEGALRQSQGGFMLTQTTETAIKAVLYMSAERDNGPIPLMVIAKKIPCSPTYLSKIMGHLTKDGILMAHRGSKGGMVFARSLDKISLLDIVNACQGFYLPSFCDATNGHPPPAACAFHQAMYEVRQTTLEILEKWKVSDLAAKPVGSVQGKFHLACKMKFLASPGAPVSEEPVLS